MIILGIDPGVSGAITTRYRSSWAVHDLPSIATLKGYVRRRLDFLATVDLLRRLVIPGDAAVAYLEEVHARPAGKGGHPQAEWSLATSRAIIECALQVVRIPVEQVPPQEWKKFYGITSDAKGAQARAMAARMVPSLAKAFDRVSDHNRAESALIAHYGARMQE